MKNILLLNQPVLDEVFEQLLKLKSKKYKNATTLLKILGINSQFYLKQLKPAELQLLSKWMNKYKINLMLNRKTIRYLIANEKGGISRIPEYIKHIKNLEYVDFGNNKISKIQLSFCNLTTLKHISLYNNKIKQIPIEIENFINIGYLNLSCNKITKLPNSICNLTTMRFLYISKNKLKRIPTEIGNLVNLIYLDFSHNLVSKIPDSFCNLINLKHFFANKNKIKTLPKEFGNLKRIQYLDLNFNLIKKLPSSFCNLESLTQLEIKKNNLKRLPKNFKNLKRLYLLDICYNAEFDYTTDLKYIKIVRNEKSSITNILFNRSLLNEVVKFLDDELKIILIEKVLEDNYELYLHLNSKN